MAIVVHALASQFAETLADFITEEVSLLLGVKDEVQRLGKRLAMIRDVLEDAERTSFTKHSIRVWLSELKDIVYDADDVLDNCRIHGEKLARMHLENSSSNAVVCCYSPCALFFHKVLFRHQIGSRIRDINVRLERAIKDKSDFGLVASGRDDRNRSRPQGPVAEPDVVGQGMKNDTKMLVGMLVAEGGGGPSISIIAIVGMGGLGKTTLAQKIYNDDTIKNNFRMGLLIWVCVSKDYSEINLMKEIIRCAGGNHGNAESLGELELILSCLIYKKKFLLILDDVWKAQVWENLLRKPFHGGAPGSRVLITTRDEHIAREIGAEYLHKVQPLSMDESWLLLQMLVFRAGEDGLETVQDTGIQIAQKCGGLPLGLKTIAGVLRSKEKTRSEWERVLQHPAWSLTDLPDGVMGVLYLSYEDLPFHLKQCFVSCGLFPSDFLFARHNLIQYWVAEGFVKEEGDFIMEDVAEGYYKELRGRSLLQADPQYYDYAGSKMHDLLHSLAQFLAGDDSFHGGVEGLVNTITSSSSSATLIKLRHLSIYNKELTSVPEVVIEQKHLRTLLFMKIPGVKEVPQHLFEKLVRLRVLNLRETTDLEKVPECIGKLIHLRYLDLSATCVESLPETFGGLSNLQYLILQNCKRLKNLPNAATKLYNLRSLDLCDTPISGLPPGVRNLQHMNRLIGFVVNENTDKCMLEEIGSLYRLRTLLLENLESTLMRRKNRGPLLKDKRYLLELVLQCSPIQADGQTFGVEESEKIQQMFEESLCPPPQVEKFVIKGYFGLHYPNWMTRRTSISLFVNIRLLHLVNCDKCTQLPALGLLPNLDVLQIQGASSVETIGPEFTSCTSSVSSVLFPKLLQLGIAEMHIWEQWIWDAEDGATIMPRLEKLLLINCPKLKSLPQGLIHHATSLNALAIKGVSMLTAVENFHSVEYLRVIENANLRKVSNLPSLQKLVIHECPLLEDIQGLNSLQTLELEDSAMETLPEWLKPLSPVVQSFHIIVSLELLQKCLKDGIEWPKIQNFPDVYIESDSGAEFVSYTKNPSTYNINLQL